MSLDLYQILLFLHLLCFVYWLGGDLGVFYSSGILIKPGLSKESRTFVLKIMKKSLYITRIPIFGIWFLVGCAGAIGVWKPF